MSTQKTTKKLNIQQESSNITDKNESLINYTHIEGTPFTIIEKEGLFIGTLGNNKLTKEFESFDECKEELCLINWDRLTQVMWCVLEKTNELLKLKEQTNE